MAWENSRSHGFVHHMEPETPKLYTIVNNIVGNNVYINIGIGHISDILYKSASVVLERKNVINHNSKKEGKNKSAWFNSECEHVRRGFKKANRYQFVFVKSRGTVDCIFVFTF